MKRTLTFLATMLFSFAAAALNVNTASMEQLQSLKGIGPKIAAEVVAVRGQEPFSGAEDLAQRVKMLGPKRVSLLIQQGLAFNDQTQ